ncbi:MAG: hypothetical protein IJF83_10350 [Methanobrevibacter sp.]|nr:hypothetical protein [Methanobrevibacter sp.]
MENKNIIIIAVAIVAIVAIAGVIFATGMLNGNNNKESTQFKTDFMEGSFVGQASPVNNSEQYMHSYVDKVHNITYNVTTVDNSSELMEIYGLQGITNPDERTFNGNDWNIYFTQAMANNETNYTEENIMNIVICESQGKNQGYLVYVIFDGKSDIDHVNSIFGQGYIEFVEPLLKTITLKESQDVPKVNEEFGLSEEAFAEQLNLIRQYQAGNVSEE